MHMCVFLNCQCTHVGSHVKDMYYLWYSQKSFLSIAVNSSTVFFFNFFPCWWRSNLKGFNRKVRLKWPQVQGTTCWLHFHSCPCPITPFTLLNFYSIYTPIWPYLLLYYPMIIGWVWLFSHFSYVAIFLVNETEQGSVELLGTKAFLCPPFLVLRKWVWFSRYDLPWVPRDRFRQLLIEEGRGCKDKEERSRSNSTSLGQDPGSLLRDTHNNIGILYV